MIQGTTPTETITVDADLRGWACYVTIKNGQSKLTIGGERLTLEYGANKSTITFTLTQQETLSLSSGTAKVQLRAVRNGTAIATDIQSIKVLPVLQEGVIE